VVRVIDGGGGGLGDGVAHDEVELADGLLGG
jgi:hypothetical protein